MWSGVGWGWYSGCSWGWSGGVYTEVGVGTQGAVGGRVVEYTLKVGLIIRYTLKVGLVLRVQLGVEWWSIH